MRHWQGLGAVLLLVGTAAGAQAAEKNWSTEGEKLKIDSPCAKSVVIQPGNDAHKVTVAASAEHQEEIDLLAVKGGQTASIDIGNARCYGDGVFGRKPTLVLTVKVPAGIALDIGEGGVARYTIGAVGGPLRLSMSGAGDAKIENAKDFSLNLSGTGNIDLDSVEGKLTVKLNGTGDVGIAHIQAPTADLQVNGKGDVKLGTGTIGTFSASLSGISHVDVEASVGDATANISGTGTVKLTKLTGHINQSVSGVGRVIVNP